MPDISDKSFTERNLANNIDNAIGGKLSGGPDSGDHSYRWSLNYRNNSRQLILCVNADNQGNGAAMPVLETSFSVDELSDLIEWLSDVKVSMTEITKTKLI